MKRNLYLLILRLIKKIRRACGFKDFKFSVPEILIAIESLDVKKSSGIDGIFPDHLKNCSVLTLSIVCKLFNSFLCHGFLPLDFMAVALSPIFKKRGLVSDINSYRPIALASCLSKLFERLLTGKMHDFLLTADNQFAYKKNSNTDSCIFAFKEIVDVYNKLGSNVYCCFLDASRAFDRISHRVLFSKLVKRNVPMIFIRVLAYWYKF